MRHVAVFCFIFVSTVSIQASEPKKTTELKVSIERTSPNFKRVKGLNLDKIPVDELYVSDTLKSPDAIDSPKKRSIEISPRNMPDHKVIVLARYSPTRTRYSPIGSRKKKCKAISEKKIRTKNSKPTPQKNTLRTSR